MADLNRRLTDLCVDRMPESRRQRGADLYRDGMSRSHPPRANLTGGTSWIVNVFDGRWWDCHVDDDEHNVLAGCTCMVRDPSACAHLWAATPAIEDRAWERRKGEHPLWRRR